MRRQRRRGMWRGLAAAFVIVLLAASFAAADTIAWTARAPVAGVDGKELAIWEATLADGDDTEILILPVCEERMFTVDSTGASVTVTGYTDHPDDLASGTYTPTGEMAWAEGTVTANTQATVWGPMTGVKAAASGGAAVIRVSALYRRYR